MPNSGTNIIFFGTEAFSLAALAALVGDGYTVRRVVTKPDRPFGRGMKLREPVVKTYARDHNIPVLQPEKLTDIEEELATIPNRIGVLSSYGKIIPTSTLSLFERGIVNVHPSLLPKYRGPAPIETPIMNGDSETGVSLMRLVAEMDAGPIYVQKTIGLNSESRASDLYKICAQTGSQLLLKSLPMIISGELKPIIQDETKVTYTTLLNKEDAQLNAAEHMAAEIERHIRAYELYPRTRLTINSVDVIVTRAHVGADADGLVVHCANNTRLTIDELIAPSGKTMSGNDFQRGYPVKK